MAPSNIPYSVGAAGDLAARDQRQQRPVGAGKYEESGRPNQCRAEMGVVSRVPNTGAHGAAEGFGRQPRRRFFSADATTPALQ